MRRKWSFNTPKYIPGMPDASMTSHCSESMVDSVTHVWWKLMRKFNTSKESIRIDSQISAKIQLQDTIEQLRGIEESLRVELRSMALQVRAAQEANAKQSMQHMLMRSHSKRIRLTQTNQKKRNLEQSLEALCMSELNEQVLSSMKKTSVALQDLGLTESIAQTDEMMLDLQETHQDVKCLQDALGQNLLPDEWDEEAMSKELDMLMSTENEAMLELPLTINKMSKASQDSATLPHEALLEQKINNTHNTDKEITNASRDEARQMKTQPAQDESITVPLV